jgi:hypothetical protein
MAGQEEQGDQADLVAEMFALLTGRLEDAAGIAGESQGRQPPAVLRSNAETLTEIIAEAATLLATVAEVLRDSGSGQGENVDYK